MIRESVKIPVDLAGGLTPANLAEAVRAARPSGVDVCTGLRTDGHLDPEKPGLFVNSLVSSIP